MLRLTIRIMYTGSLIKPTIITLKNALEVLHIKRKTSKEQEITFAKKPLKNRDFRQNLPLETQNSCGRIALFVSACVYCLLSIRVLAGYY